MNAICQLLKAVTNPYIGKSELDAILKNFPPEVKKTAYEVCVFPTEDEIVERITEHNNTF